MSVAYKVQPPVKNRDLNELFSLAWATPDESDWKQILSHSLTYICAYIDDKLVGFVNVAWDGGVHGFILDVMVNPDYQRRGIGTELLWCAVERIKGTWHRMATR